MSDYFQAAYERAQSRFTPDQWLALAPREITDAIYQEMRRMDAEAVAAIRSPDGKPATRSGE